MEGKTEKKEKETSMKKVLRILVLTGMLSALAVTAAFAAPAPDKVDAFVCPVLGGQAGGEQGNSNPGIFVTIGDGDTTILGPEVSVPIHATNENGAGSPAGDHASPGDPGYTPIWNQ
jgi:hypothetical protein